MPTGICSRKNGFNVKNTHKFGPLHSKFVADGNCPIPFVCHEGLAVKHALYIYGRP